MRRTLIVLMVAAAAVSLVGCNEPVLKGRVAKQVHYFDRTFNASPNDCYYALRWALKLNSYSLAKENLMDGVLTTSWKPVTSDSHYIPLFNRRDYGVTNSYHQLEVRVVPQGSQTSVEVGSRTKSIVDNLQSSGVEERKVLAEVANYLRAHEPDVSNTSFNDQ